MECGADLRLAGRNRRLSKDHEVLIETSTAYLKLAMIQLLVRRFARP